MTDLGDPEVVARVASLSNRLDFDFVYLLGPGTRSALPGFYASRRSKAPLILDIEDYTILQNNPFLKRFNGITVSTRFMQGLFKRYKPFYLPNSSDLIDLIEAEPKPHKTDPPEIVWHGVLYDYLLPSFRKLLDGLSRVSLPFRLTSIGRGDFNLLARLAAEYGLANRFSFEGWMTKSELARRLVHSSIGVVCPTEKAADTYRFPGKLYDYMAVGLPVICPDAGEGGLVVREAECGFAVDFGDANSLRRGLDSLLGNPRLRAECGRNGQRYLTDNRDPKVWAPRFKYYLERVLRKNRE